MKKLLVLLMASVISVSIIACSSPGEVSANEGQSINMEEEIFSAQSEISESESEDVSEVVVEEGPKVLVKMTEGNYFCEEYEYDINGNCIKSIQQYPEGTCEGYIEYQYDEEGRKIEESEYSGDGTWYETQKWQYNEMGIIIKVDVEQLYVDEEYWREYVYDENSRLVKIVAYTGSDGNYRETGVCTTYVYDDAGNVLEESMFDSINEWTTKYTYNELGQNISMAKYRNSEELKEYYEYEYDENGRLVKKYAKYQDSDTFYTYTEYEYDEEGLLIEENVYSMDGELKANESKKYYYEHLSIEN